MIIKATTEQQIQDARSLLSEYGDLRNHDEALGDYQTELAGLPGEYSQPQGCLLLAYEEDLVLGCVAYRMIDRDICEMKRLYVRPSAHGKGYAQELVKQLITEARSSRYNLMRLDTHPWMDKARQLYTHFGFVEIDAYNNNPTTGIRFFELKLKDHE